MVMRRLRTLFVCSSFTCAAGSALAQWPARYNGNANGPDVATASAVDNRGNVYVTGKSWNGTNYDYVTVSYDRNGNVRTDWGQNPKVYDGPTPGGDDIPTSIAVDFDGNVVVGGTSYGGTGRGYDLCVIKYGPDGSIVWPATGTYTGYEFHNGALRTTYWMDEGRVDHSDVYVSMAVKESLAAGQRLIAITGLAKLEESSGYAHVRIRDEANFASRRSA